MISKINSTHIKMSGVFEQSSQSSDLDNNTTENTLENTLEKTLEKTLCWICDRWKHNSECIVMLGTCESCMDKIIYYNEHYPTRNTFTCAECQEEKPIAAFGYNFKKSSFDSICIKCDNVKSNLLKYTYSIYKRFKQKINNDKRTGTLSIKQSDIRNQYEKQNGRCAISDQTMTLHHTICQFYRMIVMYPDNMIVQLIDPVLGYLPTNFILVCAKFFDSKKTPGFNAENVWKNRNCFPTYGFGTNPCSNANHKSVKCVYGKRFRCYDLDNRLKIYKCEEL